MRSHDSLSITISYQFIYQVALPNGVKEDADVVDSNRRNPLLEAVKQFYIYSAVVLRRFDCYAKRRTGARAADVQSDRARSPSLFAPSFFELGESCHGNSKGTKALPRMYM